MKDQKTTHDQTVDVSSDHHKYKKKTNPKWPRRVITILCLLSILCGAVIAATLLTLLRKASRKNLSAELRWNSTGITILGQARVAGSAANQTYLPYGIAFDSSGALYVADSANNRIQKINKGTSIATTVAGQMNAIFGNDSSHLYRPVHMSFDSSDNMYVSDRGNNRIQFFTRGNLSGNTVAGITGEISFGNVNAYICLIFKGSPGYGYNQLNYPTGIVYDIETRYLYIGDTINNRLMRYKQGASNGTVVAGGNWFGSGTSQLAGPYCFYLDKFSNSFIIGNYELHNVLRWTLGASNWTLVADNRYGVAGNDSTTFTHPMGVTLDPMGNVYVADVDNQRVQFFFAGQSTGQTIAGITGVLGWNSTLLQGPYWLILDNQLNLYVSDTWNHRIQMFKRY